MHPSRHDPSSHQPAIPLHTAEEHAQPVELRGMCPREIIDVLDAVCISKRISRIELVNSILRRWAAERQHEAMLVTRVAKSNPVMRESLGGDLES